MSTENLGSDAMISGAKLRAVRVKRKLSLRLAAREIGISEAQLSRIETGANMPSLAHLNRLATYYKVPIHSLLETDITLEAITVQGAVAVGKLVANPIWPQQQWFTILVPPSKQHPGVERRGLRVETDDVDLLFPIDTILDVMDPLPIDQIADKTLVIVHHTDPQGLSEILVRELRREPDGTVWLWPRSTNPRHQQPLVYRPDGDSLAIVGQVIGFYRSI